MSLDFQLNEFVQNTNFFQIRLIEIPFHSVLHYNLEHNKIFLTFDNRITYQQYIYSIKGNLIEYNSILSDQVYKVTKTETIRRLIFFQNWIILIRPRHVFKINVNNLDDFQILQDSKFQQIHKCYQLNKNKCLMKRYEYSTVYQLRNLKKSQNIFYKYDIISTQYYEFIIKAFTEEHLYQYDINMTKQIRKSSVQWIQEATFNSNFLFKKSKQQDHSIKIDIHDICSMRLRGTIITGNIPDKSLRCCMYIRDHNIIAILKQSSLDLYDFQNLKLIGSEMFGDQWAREIMIYDKGNGLSIFQ